MCTLSPVRCKANLVFCNVNTVLCNVNTVLCNVNTVLCNGNAVFCNVNTVLCNVNTVLCNGNTVFCNQPWFGGSHDQPRLAMINPRDGVVHLDGIEDAKEALAEYTDICPSFINSSEHLLVRALMQYTLSLDPKQAEKEAQQFLRCHTVDPWVSRLLGHIVENIRTKIQAIDQLSYFPPTA